MSGSDVHAPAGDAPRSGLSRRSGPRLATAFRRIVRANVARARVHLPDIAAGDAEGVHQTRVALRRLRSAVALFRPSLGTTVSRPLETRLKTVAQALGDARDWDVLVEETLPALLSTRDRAKTAALLETAEQLRKHARAAAKRALSNKGLTGSLVQLERASGEFADTSPLGDCAGDWLDRRWKTMRKRGGKDPTCHGAASLHDARIALKKLRYAVEFTDGLYDRTAHADFLAQLTDLQRGMGGLNDLAVALELVARLRTEPAIDGAARLVEKRIHRAYARDAKQVRKPWRALIRSEPFWK
jgi:CHAD domain-containing protein